MVTMVLKHYALLPVNQGGLPMFSEKVANWQILGKAYLKLVI